MHSKATWPMHGKYVCTECFREYAVPWEELPTATEYPDPTLRDAGIPREADLVDNYAQ